MILELRVCPEHGITTATMDGKHCHCGATLDLRQFLDFHEVESAVDEVLEQERARWQAQIDRLNARLSRSRLPAGERGPVEAEPAWDEDDRARVDA